MATSTVHYLEDGKAPETVEADGYEIFGDFFRFVSGGSPTPRTFPLLVRMNDVERIEGPPR